MSQHYGTATQERTAWHGVRPAQAAWDGEGRQHTPPQPAPPGTHFSYLPGLDGLRAISVLAVLLYHAGIGWLPGGFLGVEAFFVISGFLITALLLAEWRGTGRLDLRRFWLRRARRLLPALFLVLAATLAVVVLFLPGEVAKVRGDVLAALGYATNWYYILRQQSYFETVGRPSPLLHLWSLAIEEQFYLVWPPLLLLLLRRWGERGAACAVLAGAVASTATLAALYRPGADPSRPYYGTDTRAAGLLIGALLAFAWAGRAGNPLGTGSRNGSHDAVDQDRAASGQVRSLRLDGLGFGALALLVALFLGLDEFQPALYRGGFALVAVATAATIAVAVSPAARWFPRGLEWRPLRWIGARSYGIYLWHWPIFVLTRPGLDVPLDGPPLLALRLGATVALAALSYRWVEAPIRAGALGRAWQVLAPPRDGRAQRRVALGSGFAGACAGLLLALTVAAASARPPAPPAELAVGAVELTVTGPPVDTAAVEAIEAPPAPSPGPEVAPAAAPSPCVPSGFKGITAFGDSVLVGASGNLALRVGEGLSISAEVGRQPWDMPTFLRERREAGQLGDVVVIHVGNNGYLTDENFDAIMVELADTSAAIFVNVRVPRNWERNTNSVLSDGVGRYGNAVLVDWHGESGRHPEYFLDDGVHLTPAGRAVFATLIAERVEAAKARWAAQAPCTPAAETPPVPTAPPPPPREGAGRPGARTYAVHSAGAP